MKILHLVSNYEHGGVQQVVGHLNNEMNLLGHKSRIVCVYKRTTDDLGIGNVEILSDHSIKGVQYITALLKLLFIIVKVRPDLIICHMPMTSIAGILLALLLKIKKRIIVHHNPLQSYPMLFRTFYALAFKTHAIGASISVSRSVHDSMFPIHGSQSEKSHVVKNEIKIPESLIESTIVNDLRRTNPGKRIVATVGRLEEQKNQACIINAVALSNDVVLIIVGSGSMKTELTSLVKDLSIEERVIFIESLPRNDVISLIHSIDAFILSSYYEGMPLVLMEAVAVQKPVFISNISANCDLTSSKLGTFPPGDYKALAHLINQEDYYRASYLYDMASRRSEPATNMACSYIRIAEQI